MVAVDVEHGDVATRRADVLVLPHAQVPRGAVRDVVDVLGGLDAVSLPDAGATWPRLRPSGLDVAQLLVVGLPAVASAGYDDARAFGTATVDAAARYAGTATEVATVLHGVDRGLDEVEALHALAAGVRDAVEAGRAGRYLQRVVVVEHDPLRAGRLQRVLPPAARASPGSAARPRRVAFDPTVLEPFRRRRAFVAMPFGAGWWPTYESGIKAPLVAAGLECERMDTVHYVGDVVSTMLARLRAADVVIAEISEPNPNVYLEVGYAWGLDQPTILARRHDARAHFDVQGQRQLLYRSITELAGLVAAELAGLGWGAVQSR